MNLNRLEAYARQARREFNAAVTDRAALYGLTAECIEPMTKQGDVVLIGARPFSADIAGPRERLADQISREVNLSKSWRRWPIPGSIAL